MKPTRVALVVNTGSRSGRRNFDQAVRLLGDRATAPAETYPIERGDELCGAVDRALRNGCDLVIVGGGDGSITSVSHSFVGKNAVLGLLPLGTGNSFAQTLGIPLDLAGAVDVIAAGNEAPIDLGIVNGHYFANVATIGLSAVVALTTPSLVKRIFGPASYLLSGIVAIRKHRSFRCTLIFDGGKDTFRTRQIVIANGRVFGNTPIAPDATADDGLLNVFSMPGASRRQVARMWTAFLMGTHGELADAKSFTTTSLRVETSSPKAVEIDGEFATKTPATFTVAKGAIRMLVPAAYPAAH